MAGAREATIHLNRFEEWPASRGCKDAADRAVRAALAEGPPQEAAAGKDDAAELSVTCVSRDEIRELNRRYLSRDAPTDVIAFELGDPDQLLGDVYLSPEVAEREAGERGIDPSVEVLRLVIHGVLHVMGWDHPEGDDREESRMYRVQEQLLAGVTGP